MIPIQHLTTTSSVHILPYTYHIYIYHVHYINIVYAYIIIYSYTSTSKLSSYYMYNLI